MSNIDDDAKEFDDLNMPSDGMPDPTAPGPTTQPPLAEDAKAVDDLVESVAAEDDDTDEPAPKRDGLGSKLVLASPFTVMLAISLLAIVVALLCLIREWGTYDYQRKPPKTLTMSRIESVRSELPGSPENRFGLGVRRTS